MGNKPPLVSIIVPSFNHDKYVEQCIESIYNQSYKNFELIVIDDGSTDGSRDVLNNLKNKYGFTLVLQENIGLSKTLNKGIKEFARGEYITFCASDDYWVQDKLEKQILFMEQNQDIPMCYGKSYIVDEKNNIIHKSTGSINKKLKGGYIFKDIFILNLHPPVNYLFRKCVYNNVGFYKDNIYTEDFYMNLRIANKYRIGYIDDFISYYRIFRNVSPDRWATKSSISLLKCINEYPESPYYHQAIRKWHFRNFMQLSMFSKYKLYSFKEMILSIRYIFSLAYLISIIRLIFIWK